MFSVLKRFFYEVPKKTILRMWDNRHRNFFLDKAVIEERHRKYLQSEIYALAYDIDLIEEFLERPITNIQKINL